jgi:hypothetical protein
MATLSGIIGEFIIPSDGIGSPNVIAIDAANSFIYFLNANGIRKYSCAAVQTQNEISQATVALKIDNDPLTAVDGQGNLIISTLAANVQNGQPVYKFSPNTLTQTGVFGTSTSGPSYPTSVWAATQIVCIEVANVPYAFIRETSEATAAVIRTDQMTGAGAHLTMSNNTNGSFMCAGLSGGSVGTVYCVNKTLSGAVASVPIYAATIMAGAEDYNIIEWPTPNPLINAALLATVTAASIDSSFTTMTTVGIGFDTNSQTIILSVLMSDSSTAFLVGVTPYGGQIAWKTQVAGGSGLSLLDLPQSRIEASGLAALAVGTGVNAVTTATGALVSDTITGISNNYARSDDQAKTLILNTTYAGSGSSSLTPASGTPNGFSGWAITNAFPVFGYVPPFSPPVAVEQPSLGGWRGIVGINWLGMALVGDAYSGVIGLSDFTAFTEYGQPMRMLVTSPPVQEDRKRVFIRKFEVDVQSGVGNAASPKPIMRLDYSHDGGETWKPLLVARSMGAIGEYTRRLRWLNLGMSRSWVLRLTCTDPVRRVIIGTYINVAPGTGS